MNEVVVFLILSNAAYPMSLRGPGAELEGGGAINDPLSDGGKSRGSAISRAQVKPFCSFMFALDVPCHWANFTWRQYKSMV